MQRIFCNYFFLHRRNLAPLLLNCVWSMLSKSCLTMFVSSSPTSWMPLESSVSSSLYFSSFQVVYALEYPFSHRNLKCTCPYCETQGATIAVRPYCGKCKYFEICCSWLSSGECMVYDDPSQMKMGSASWKTLLRVNGKCINSSCANYNVSERVCFWFSLVMDLVRFCRHLHQLPTCYPCSETCIF